MNVNFSFVSNSLLYNINKLFNFKPTISSGRRATNSWNSFYPQSLKPYHHQVPSNHRASQMSGTPIPPILYGTAWKGEATDQLVVLACRCGFRGIDSAGQRKHYREDLVGEGLAIAHRDFGIRRKDLWLQSKFTAMAGQDPYGEIPYDPSAPVSIQVRQSFYTSLKNLHPYNEHISRRAQKQKAESTERSTLREEDGEEEPYLDSYLLHSPLETLEATMEAWRTMEELVAEGRVRRIGVSNVYDPRILSFLRSSSSSTSALSILQNRFHGTNGHDVSLLSSLSPILSPNDFPSNSSDGSIPEGIIYQSFWLLTGNPQLLSSKPVTELARKRNWTPQQVVYKFSSQGWLPGMKSVPLCGSTSQKHLEEAITATVYGEDFTIEELSSIRRIIYGE